MNPIPKAFGLTGGISSGKSTVCRFFEELGVLIINADEINRKLCKQGEAGWQKIKEAFGEGILTPEGELDRKKLSDLIFSDDKKRAQLEGLTHPLIQAQIRQKIKTYFDKGGELVLVEAALLMESQYDKEFHGTIVVSCTPEQQLGRLCHREGISEKEGLARIQTQWPIEKKAKLATFVIDNSGSLENTRQQTKVVYEKIRAKRERTSPTWH